MINYLGEVERRICGKLAHGKMQTGVSPTSTYQTSHPLPDIHILPTPLLNLWRYVICFIGHSW